MVSYPDSPDSDPTFFGEHDRFLMSLGIPSAHRKSIPRNLQFSYKREELTYLFQAVAKFSYELFLPILGAYLYDRAKKPHRPRKERASTRRQQGVYLRKRQNG